ncbi:MAG: adenylate/guanylate cyclase domain-containing protein [Chloroflexi bacterium]|nr:adenylate/guanylate cyclase domain-containing protein [Chloroflexota bacterium]
MEQQVEYCTTSDGVRIAYASVGEGCPLIVVPGWLTHLHYTWEEAAQAFWKQLARQRRVVRYDGRGMGLSQRDPADYSLDARIKDLEAVIDVLGSESVELLGMSEGGPTAIAFAVRNPDRVQKLILYGTYPRFPVRSEDVQALLPLIRRRWGMGSAALTAVFIPKSDPEQAAEFTRLQRMAMTGEVAARTLEENMKTDVTQLLPKVTIPTLVVHRRHDRVHPVRVAQEMAAAIPNAQLNVLEGEAYPPWMEDSHSVLASVARFLGLPELDEEAEQEAARLGGLATTLSSGTAIILFLDIAASTALTTKLGDAAYRERERELDASLRAAITEAAGTPVEGKVLGDGVMAVFTSARNAIDAAQRCRDLGNEAGLPLHLGIHAGDVVREGNNVHGGAVQVAARVQSAAAPGEVLVSATVRDLARTSAGVVFEDRGEHDLKGIPEPQRLFAVREQD